MSLNRSILAGRLAADPVVRYTQDETAVAEFHLNISGEGSHNKIVCVATGGLAKISGEYLCKGKLVAVEGRLKIESIVGKTGLRRSHTTLMVENLQMLDSKFGRAVEKHEG